MTKSIIRLQKIIIQNLKNVALGEIRFSCNLWEDIYERKADVLGVYGQNGSGKTTLICALSLLKGLMSGTALPMNFSNIIKCGEQAAVCSFEFSVVTEEQEKYKVVYQVTLSKEASLNKDNPVERSVVITNEILSISKLQANRYEKSKSVKILVIADNEDEANIKVFPGNFFKDFLKETKKETKKENIEELLSKSFKNGISYLFSKEILSETKTNNTEFYTIIHLLNYYATYQLHIISNVQSGVINANIALPFSFVLEDKKSVSMLYGSLKLNGTSLLPKDLTPAIQQKIELVNVVLGELVPGLSIRLVELEEQIGEDGEKLIETQLLARRGENEILLQYESDGIKKLISILYTVILGYRDASVTVAIDELDSGIFEFLLGEILQMFEESGQGQLIFTSHNLRPLEVLNKKNILFTTTNEKHRYIRLQNVRTNQNLRDFYYHDIILGGQKECIYEMTNPYVIRKAFKMAGDSDAK